MSPAHLQRCLEGTLHQERRVSCISSTSSKWYGSRPWWRLEGTLPPCATSSAYFNVVIPHHGGGLEGTLLPRVACLLHIFNVMVLNHGVLKDLATTSESSHSSSELSWFAFLVSIFSLYQLSHHLVILASRPQLWSYLYIAL